MAWKIEQLQQVGKILLVCGLLLVLAVITGTMFFTPFLGFLNLAHACFGTVAWYGANWIAYRKWYICLIQGNNLNQEPIKVVPVRPSLNLQIMGLSYRKGTYASVGLMLLLMLVFVGLLILLHRIFLLWLVSGLGFSQVAYFLIGQGLWYQSLYKRLDRVEKALGCELILSLPHRRRSSLLKSSSPRLMEVTYYKPRNLIKDAPPVLNSGSA